jgi:hypothetical protein
VTVGVWKGLDWSLMDLLFEKAWIMDPQSKVKSVVLTDEGERLARVSSQPFRADFSTMRLFKSVVR